jgi:hypothetical protein
VAKDAAGGGGVVEMGGGGLVVTADALHKMTGLICVAIGEVG